MKVQRNHLKTFAEAIGENRRNICSILNKKRDVSCKKARDLEKKCSNAGLNASAEEWGFNPGKIKARLPIFYNQLIRNNPKQHATKIAKNCRKGMKGNE